MSEMNKERLEMLAAHLEKLPDEDFDMIRWCGTACCVAGHVRRLVGRQDVALFDFGIKDGAKQWLGLDQQCANELFVPIEDAPYKATPQQAASVVRHLKDTGVVAWEKFL